jgi:multidrug transporter EmrE-like cation transporter
VSLGLGDPWWWFGRVSAGGEEEMNAVKLVAIALIVAGILGLAYGKFSYTKETHEVKLGSLELSVKDKQTVNIPVWAGVGAIVAGGVLLLWRKQS